MTVPFCFAWLVDGPRQQNAPMPVPCLSVRITPWPIEPPLQIWRCPMSVSERAPLQSTVPKDLGGQQTQSGQSLGPKSFWRRWSKVVPISTSVAWNSISCVRSASGMCVTTVIANVAATMIAPKATTCASEPTARKVNSGGNARHQRLPRSGFCRHGAVRQPIGGAGSVWNGKIMRATTGMSGWRIRAIRRCPSCVLRCRRLCAHTGRLVCP